jgi:hypothetical protein
MILAILFNPLSSAPVLLAGPSIQVLLLQSQGGRAKPRLPSIPSDDLVPPHFAKNARCTMNSAFSRFASSLLGVDLWRL